MSALIRQLRRNDSRSSQSRMMEEGWSDLEYGISTRNVTVFDPTAEKRIRQATHRVTALETEMETLRHELLEAERTINLLEQLLRNMQIREQELRRELVSDHY